MFGDSWAAAGAARAAPSRGSDLRYNLEISLEDAFRGKQTTIRVAHLRRLRQLQRQRRRAGLAAGRPARPATAAAGCARSRASSRSSAPARPARAPGTVIDKPCKACGGQGRVAAREDAVGQHPARGRGRHPHPPRRRGRGRAARRRRRAISTSSSRITPHAIFQRDGANIFCRVPIPITTAALGGTIEVPTVDGSRTRVTVPPAPNRATSSGCAARA